ncbi:PLP-dependent transferase [Patellaria atrata CBS 101060]|uniref:PLP-dependent transferase n=1 Tax=Patellaria atrata CBS 101060 TaxID=1346257 RepID=A0A9P4S7P0_9PEZI|nr:PLP-dependent transferase [Patellaria atrata CBS 101060]
MDVSAGTEEPKVDELEGYNYHVEEIREREYPMLKGKTYLDHGGTTLYAKSLVDDFSADLLSNLYGNPHSDSTPAALAGHKVDEVRERTLRFFNADPEHFDLVFVANASAAVKLVMEAFRDYADASKSSLFNSKNFWYGYHRDAHTSVVGVRELTNGRHRCFQSDDEVEKWIAEKDRFPSRRISLFGYPGQSNMTGRRLPLSWPGKIRRSKPDTYTLLDAAALATTCPIDLSNEEEAPDFISMSFYKVFGFPNLGALIVRKRASHMFQHRKYFGGGTVDMVVSINDTWHARKDSSLHDQLEDGTTAFHAIFALNAAIDVHQRLFGSMKQVSAHTTCLARELYRRVTNLKHYDGSPVVHVYKDDAAIYGDSQTQSATIAFNVTRTDGALIGYTDVEKLADSQGIYVRSGGLCNPGGVATYLDWRPWEMKASYAAGHRCSKPTQVMKGKPTGVVRVSLGAMSTMADVNTFLNFIQENYMEEGPAEPPTPKMSSKKVEFNLEEPQKKPATQTWTSFFSTIFCLKHGEDE